VRGTADTNLLVRVVAQDDPAQARAAMDLLATRAVVTDPPAVKCGLRLLAAGGDFADAVIAFNGRRLGGERCVSFDRRAVQLLADLGKPADLLQA
jgi:predicted nucleic-acid-binding protein